MTREAAATTAKFELNEGVVVITDDDRTVQPGSGEMGKIATSSFVPWAITKIRKKSAATFREINGVRYSFPGDYATVEADGSITCWDAGAFASTRRVRKCSRRKWRKPSNATSALQIA